MGIIKNLKPTGNAYKVIPYTIVNIIIEIPIWILNMILYFLLQFSMLAAVKIDANGTTQYM